MRHISKCSYKIFEFIGLQKDCRGSQVVTGCVCYSVVTNLSVDVKTFGPETAPQEE